jgi:hypothetical protein
VYPPTSTLSKESTMRIGTTVGLQLDGPQTISEVVDEVRRADELGLDGAWWAQLLGWDALTALTVAGLQVPGLPLGTAIVTTYPATRWRSPGRRSACRPSSGVG